MLIWRLFLLIFAAYFVVAPALAEEADTAGNDRIMQIIQATTDSHKLNGLEVARAPKAKPAPLPDPEPEDFARLVYQFLPLIADAGDTNNTPSLLPLLSSQALNESHRKITRAVIIVHDSDRNAGVNLERLKALAGAAASGTDAQIMILAPMFPSQTDVPAFATSLREAANHIALWAPSEWPYGGDTNIAHGQAQVSSMTALDVLLLYLADKNFFPNLEQVVLAGFGSGGDLVHRYALYGKALEVVGEQGLKPRFVVAASRSYVYMTDIRPKGKDGFTVPADVGKACPDYMQYPFGTEAPNNYTRQIAANVARQNYAGRDVTYLVGRSDIIPPEDRCGAKLQGKSIKTRAENYNRYIQTLFGDEALSHRLSVINGIGDDAEKLWSSNCGISLLFADGECIKE